METPSDKRLRRHTGMEVWVRCSLSVWYFFQVSSQYTQKWTLMALIFYVGLSFLETNDSSHDMV